MAKPLIQMALDRLFLVAICKTPAVMTITDTLRTAPVIEFTKTPIPKPSRKMYQTRRGKWINCK